MNHPLEMAARGGGAWDEKGVVFDRIETSGVVESRAPLAASDDKLPTPGHCFICLSCRAVLISMGRKYGRREECVSEEIELHRCRIALPVQVSGCA
ncbi:hypothetical protein CEXT_19611 [Caerostris extrusa]|uniref:Uncharacterized protein n=1 Tax=Caerostris extrusa TaxID=172846 RepID=A0AAV4TPQ3_CAEEX|nr:hypothetical protein CEXT_19611 [Caerostris extrusa]